MLSIFYNLSTFLAGGGGGVDLPAVIEDMFPIFFYWRPPLIFRLRPP